MSNQNSNNQSNTQNGNNQPSRSTYDPAREYFNRRTVTSKANRVARQQHQFADSIGGCSANYRY